MMGGDDRLRRRGRLPNRGYPISNWRPVDFQLAAPTGRASRGRHKLRRARRRCLHRCANAGRHGRCGARRVGPRPTIPASPSCSPPAMPRRRPLARGTCFCRSRIALTSSPVSCVRSRRLPGNRRLADLKVAWCRALRAWRHSGRAQKHPNANLPFANHAQQAVTHRLRRPGSPSPPK